MGLFQKAYETYEAHSALAGKEEEGKQILLPVGFVLAEAEIEICLEADGSFSSATYLGKDSGKIPIPATEASSGRSGKDPKAHPLCDKIIYMDPAGDKFQGYLDGLKDWAGSPYSSPMVEAIATYVEGGTILNDLSSMGIIELDEKGQLKKPDQIVRWRVRQTDLAKDGCWQNEELMGSYQKYYQEKLRRQGDIGLCMITGKQDSIATMHAKAIVPIHGNAKLISSNDTKGFTYRGRFETDRQAVTISYETSQKAHNALKWLVADQSVGMVYDGRTFLCWNPNGTKICHAVGAFGTDREPSLVPSDYKRQLKKTLEGHRSSLPEGKCDVVIAAFDAASKGRLAVTYYNELQGSDYLQRLYEWDLNCCWYCNKEGEIASPLLWQIVNCAYGVEKQARKKSAKGNAVFFLETPSKLLRQQIQRLLSCRVDRARMPIDIMKSLVDRASYPLSYSYYNREQILWVACAVIKKFYYDRYKEEYEMAYDKDKKDRSYQFGALLAVVEKVERDTFDKAESREPNAIRLQSMFRRRPMYTFSIIQEQLDKAYFPKLKPGQRGFYRKRIGDIMAVIDECAGPALDDPLDENYLMGYYLQRKDLYTAKDNG